MTYPCFGRDDLFFPEDNDYDRTIKQAREICGTCPLDNAECYSRAKPEDHGIWGGTTPDERRQMRRYFGVPARS